MTNLSLDSQDDESIATPPHDVKDIVLPTSLTFDDDDSRDSGFESHDSENEVSPVTRQFGSFNTPSPTSPKYVRRSLFFGKRSHNFQDSPTKRVRTDSAIHLPESNISVTAAVIKSAVNKLETEENLIGDGSKSHILPTVQGRHKDLKTLSPNTVSQLLEGKYNDVISGYKIIDCRYPYEFVGGHIEGAINLYDEELIAEMMNNQLDDTFTEKSILIFHCEFSSERGPKLLRHLRSLDRKLNSDRYPFLFYPEVYLLDGGYKAFFEQNLFSLTPSTTDRMTNLSLDSQDDESIATPPHDVKDIVLPTSLTFDDDDSRDSGFESHDSENEVSPVTRQFGSFNTPSPTSPKYVRRSLFFGKRSHNFQDSPTKRVRTDSAIHLPESNISVTAAVIKSAVNKLETEENLIGDGSKSHILPTVQGRHKDLKTLSPNTVSQLLEGKYNDVISGYKIIDCRYPYEFVGGHIEGAINLYDEELIAEMMNNQLDDTFTEKSILIFHCEFSSERGPKLLRHLRSLDRKLNSDRYPFLFYPEVYLLDGGYKAFFEQNLSQCEPESYRTMLDEEYSSELRHFRSRSKSKKTGKHQTNRARRQQVDASPLKCLLW